MCDAKRHVAHALKITEKFLITKTEWLCIAAVCGYQKGGLSLQPIQGGKRLILSAKLEDCKILTRLNFRYDLVSKQPKVEQNNLALQLTFDI